MYREIDRRLRSTAKPPSLYLVVLLLVSFAVVFGLQFYLLYGKFFWQFAAMLCLAFALLRAAFSHDRASVLCLVVLAWILAAVGWNRHWMFSLGRLVPNTFSRDEMPEHLLTFIIDLAPVMLLSIPIALIAQGQISRGSLRSVRWIAAAALIVLVDAFASLAVELLFFSVVGTGDWFPN